MYISYVIFIDIILKMLFGFIRRKKLDDYIILNLIIFYFRKSEVELLQSLRFNRERLTYIFTGTFNRIEIF